MKQRNDRWESDGVAYPTETVCIGKGSEFVIFFHGMYGSVFSSAPERSKMDVASALAHRYRVRVGLYETSRKVRYTGGDFVRWADTAFSGKTFDDERSDVRLALQNLKRRARNPDRIVFVGFSLGGTLATFFLNTHKPRALLMFGSGNATFHTDRPVGKGYPDKERINNNLRRYRGIVNIYQGTEDDSVPPAGAEEMFRSAVLAQERRLVLLRGVDHRFLSRNGKRDTQLDRFLIDEIGTVVEQIRRT